MKGRPLKGNIVASFVAFVYGVSKANYTNWIRMHKWTLKKKALQEKNNEASGIALLVDNEGEGIEEWFHPSPGSAHRLCVEMEFFCAEVIFNAHAIALSCH